MDLCWQWFDAFVSQQQNHRHQHLQQQQRHHQHRHLQQQRHGQTATENWGSAATMVASPDDSEIAESRAAGTVTSESEEPEREAASGGSVSPSVPAVSMDLCAVMAAACAQVSMYTGEHVHR